LNDSTRHARITTASQIIRPSATSSLTAMRADALATRNINLPLTDEATVRRYSEATGSAKP
jgi:hypothetical protein